MSVLSDLDRRLYLFLHGGDATSPLAIAMTVLTVIGGGWGMLALVPLAGFARTRRFAAALAAGILAQAAIVYMLKMAIGRVRPWRALQVTPLFDAPTDFSFPSGHAAGVFTAATLAVVWLRAPAWRALALAFAAAVSFSRVYLGAHYPGDVLAGAALGVAIGLTTASVLNRRRRAAIARV